MVIEQFLDNEMIELYCILDITDFSWQRKSNHSFVLNSVLLANNHQWKASLENGGQPLHFRTRMLGWTNYMDCYFIKKQDQYNIHIYYRFFKKIIMRNFHWNIPWYSLDSYIYSTVKQYNFTSIKFRGFCTFSHSRVLFTRVC